MNTYNIIKFRELKNEVYELVKYISDENTSNIESGVYHKKVITKIFRTKVKVNNGLFSIGQCLEIYDENNKNIKNPNLDSVVMMSLYLIKILDEFMANIKEYKAYIS